MSVDQLLQIQSPDAAALRPVPDESEAMATDMAVGFCNGADAEVRDRAGDRSGRDRGERRPAADQHATHRAAQADVRAAYEVMQDARQDLDSANRWMAASNVAIAGACALSPV